MSYSYSDNIKSPSEAGVKVKGTFQQVGKNMDAVGGYGDLMITGSGLSKTGQPLGGRSFVKTSAQCAANDTSGNVTRYIYTDNVPDFSDGLNGLIPGIFGDLEDTFDPTELENAVFGSDLPKCRQAALHTIDDKNNNGFAQQYVTDDDLKTIDACRFESQVHPITGAKCSGGGGSSDHKKKPSKTIKIKGIPTIKKGKSTRHGFIGNMQFTSQPVFFQNSSQLPNDPIVLLYVFGVGLLFVYMLYCLLCGRNKHGLRKFVLPFH
jgi:hypothetical protein